MSGLDSTLLDALTAPVPRLPAIERWLLDEVWSDVAFDACSRSPAQFLLRGERMVNERETLLAATAPAVYRELANVKADLRTVGRFFEAHPGQAAVVFDGCSLRELPRLRQLASASRRAITEIGCSRAAMPSETVQFVATRLELGLPVLGPSQLTSRGELKERKVRYCYFGQPNSYHTIEACEESLLLWSRFPDQRYTDSTAVDEGLFEGVWDSFDTIWRNTVQALPPDRTVLVTSDHGYVFLKTGLSDTSHKNIDKPLDGKRFRFFEAGEALPPASPGMWIDEPRRLAVLTGRTHNRPQAPSASQSVYRHGGLSLMEILTPWLVLGPVGSA